MAYRFDGIDDQLQFSPGSLAGYTAGAFTFALLMKRLATTSNRPFFATDGSGTGSRQHYLNFGSTSRPESYIANNGNTGPTDQAISSLTTWYIVAVTWNGTGTIPRFHRYDGSSWLHGDGTIALSPTATAIQASDRIRLGTLVGTNFANIEVVCAGLDKANHTDGEIQALTMTAFQSWLDFGFDWLVGLETSVAQTDRTGGGGNETSRTGTTLVSDPPGWEWGGPLVGRFTRLKLGDGLTGTDQGAGVIELAATGGGGGLFFTGSGPPTASTGVDGSIYLDYTSFRFWGPKAAGAWPATAFARAISLVPTYDDIKDG